MGKINQIAKRGKALLFEQKALLFHYKKQLLTILVIYLLAFSGIIRADFAYWDDIGRIYEGYHGWLDWSRYSTEILATFVHAGWHLTDISPFPQILACVIMAAAGIFLLEVFGNGKRVGFFQILAVSLTALTPYFLGMISYKFDSPYMALSLLVCVVPFLFRRQRAEIYAAVSVFCLLIMCTTYQASSGIYPMIAAFLAMEDIAAGKEYKNNLKFLGVSALSYLGSLGFFWMFLMRDNGVSVSSSADFFPLAAKRYITYYEIIWHDFSKIWLFLILAIVFFFLISFCLSAKINKLYALGLGVFMVFLGSILCFGVNLFISREAYDVRSMYGFNIFLALLAVFLSFHSRNWIPKVVYAALVWCFFVFSLTYGNALAQQQDYMQYRTELLAGDLNDLDIMNTEEIKEVLIVGDIGYSPVIERMAEDYPILDRASFTGSGDGLICTGLGEGFWGGYYFYNYLKIPNIRSGSESDIDPELPVIKETMYHTIRGSGSLVVIELK